MDGGCKVCVGVRSLVFGALADSLCTHVRIAGKGKGSVSEGSGLTAGYSRDTLNSHVTCLTGSIQHTRVCVRVCVR